MKLKPPDSHHFRAAQGWLELGNHLEADQELDAITPQLRVHPDVLDVRWQVYAAAKKWDGCLDIADALTKLSPHQSLGWIHRSFALHELQRTQEAFDQLFPMVTKFRTVWTIPYNLACYCAQLGRIAESETWFKQAMHIDEHKVQQAAQDDPDLKPLWDSMAGSLWRRE